MAHHLCIIICVNFPSILSFLSPNESHEDSVLIGIIVFVVFGLPAVIIHVNYYLVNKDDILKYSDEHRKIVIIHKGVTTTFSLDDIDYVKQYISFNEAENRSPVATWDEYNHSVIYLKDGKIFTITSLLVAKLELPIENKKIVRKKNIYRLAKIR